MLVCICKGVSDSKIRTLVENGAQTVREVMSHCQAGKDCGTCICDVKRLVEKTLTERQTNQACCGHHDIAVGE